MTAFMEEKRRVIPPLTRHLSILKWSLAFEHPWFEA